LTIVPFGLTVPNLELMGLWATAFPDGRTDVSRIIAEGDAVAVEYLGSGTHAGEFKLPWGSLPPTNRRAELHFIDVHRITNGRIAESRHYFDVLSMCGQLGVDPRVMVREPIAVGSST
jgi:predicted ester cyclase